MRKITIGMVILSIILIGMVIPAGFSDQVNSVVITYGETTHANTNYLTLIHFSKVKAIWI